jgi:hypothetical protein
MKSVFTRKTKSSLQRLLGDLPAFTEPRQQFVELRQQVGDLQLQLVHLQEGLLANQFDHSSRRRILDETATISQAVQLLLRQKLERWGPMLDKLVWHADRVILDDLVFVSNTTRVQLGICATTAFRSTRSNLKLCEAIRARRRRHP